MKFKLLCLALLPLLASCVASSKFGQSEDNILPAETPATDKGLEATGGSGTNTSTNAATSKLVGGVTSATSIGDWAEDIIELQDLLDENVALSQALWLGAHNSFNSKNEGYKVDPNQSLSLKDQLRQGVRYLTFDIHWYGGQLRLCHALNNHVGCSTSDMKFRKGLQKVKEYVRDENPNAVVIIWMSDKASGKHSKMANEINDKIGDYLYRPDHQGGSGCRSLNAHTLTKRQVRAAGKNIIMVTSENCKGNGKLEKAIFDDFTYSEGVGFLPITNISVSDERTKMVRVMDAQTIRDIAGSSKKEKVTPANVTTYLSAGTNIFDMANFKGDNDNRLIHFAWSWDSSNNEPNGTGACAKLYSASDRFRDANCSNSFKVACLNKSTSIFKVTSGAATFSQAAAKCQSEFGSNYKFSVPASKFMKDRLVAARNASVGLVDVWVNYEKIGSAWLPEP